MQEFMVTIDHIKTFRFTTVVISMNIQEVMATIRNILKAMNIIRNINEDVVTIGKINWIW